ncbi:MAG: shikimate kinase, partial [Lachnospiraceae bacterium]|nr:shikimate kinase [Lachnospiraceae bacterium]
SGKTTVGRIVARKLGYEFFDTDKYIEQKEKMSITDIFEKKGEPYFRSLELEVAKEISESKNKVIGTGGGMVKNDEIMKLLKANGVVVYLKASPGKIAHNLRNDNTRPLLEGGDKFSKIKALLKERDALYIKAADITINTDKKVPKSAAADIIEKLEGII